MSVTISSQNYCANNLQLRYVPNQCDLLDKDQSLENIQFRLFPNPTYHTTDVMVDNFSKSTDWLLNIYNENGLLISSTKEYIPSGSSTILHYNLESFTPGVYYFNFIDDNTTVSKKLIKLKN